MSSYHTFRVISSENAGPINCGALRRVAKWCEEILASVKTDIGSRRLSQPCCIFGAMLEPSCSPSISKVDFETILEYPLNMKTPFEGVATISGGVWDAADICMHESNKDALLKLHFHPKTANLPIHSHDYSDRVILVAKGHGTFAFNPPSQPSTSQSSVNVREGDVLLFTRGFQHTFRTDDSDLFLLSYHSPFIDLDDPKQFAISE